MNADLYYDIFSYDLNPLYRLSNTQQFKNKCSCCEEVKDCYLLDDYSLCESCRGHIMKEIEISYKNALDYTNQLYDDYYRNCM